MKNFFITIFIAALIALPQAGLADNSSDVQKNTELEDMVVTAGRVKEPKKYVVNSMAIMDDQEISQSSANDVGSLLAQKGIGFIKKYPGALTSIGIRGFRTETHGNDLKGHVLILLNGRRAGTGNVAKILTKNVERIEIIRGPASVQYGSAAVGGVVNIITRQGQGEISGFVEGRLGSFGAKEVSAGISGEINKFDFSGAVTKGSADDYTTGGGDKYKNTGVENEESLSLNLGYSFLPNNRIGFIFNGFNFDESGSPDYLSQNDLDNYTDNSNSSFDLIVDGQTADADYLWSVRYFQGEDKDRWGDPTASNTSGWDDGIPSDRVTKNQGAQAQFTAKIGNASITTGFDWSDYDIEADWTPDKTSYENLAGFLLGKIRFFDDRLTLSGGLRYDTYEVEVIEPSGTKEDDENITPNIGLSFLWTDNLKLRAGYAQSFVMPSADHMAANWTTWGTNYVGNPDLSPETSDTYETGFDFFYGSFTSGLTYFYTDFKDKIESVTRLNGDKSWDNVGKARIQGFEGNLSCDIGEFFGWDFEVRPFAGFTFLTEYKDRDTKDDLLYTHDITASYGIAVSDFKGFHARLNFAYYGEKTITDFESGFPYSDIKAKAFTVADFTVSKKIFTFAKKSSLTLDAAVNNLFDKEYEFVKGFPMPGRSFYLGMKYEF